MQNEEISFSSFIILHSSLQLMRRLGQIVVDRLLLGLIAVEAEEDHVIVDACLQMHGALPDLVDVS
jgi:hypothetical protein